MIAITEESPEVFYTSESIVAVGALELAFLKERARANLRKRSRLCTHSTSADTMHEMIIVHHRDCYVRPHRHRRNDESLHVIEGSADVVAFSDNGEITSTFAVSESGGQHAFYYRMPPMQYHMLLITSEWFVFHEATKGPFVRENTQFPDWAPESDPLQVHAFLTRARERIERVRQGNF